MKFPLPNLDAAFLASLMRGLMAVLVLAAVVAVANELISRIIRRENAGADLHEVKRRL